MSHPQCSADTIAACQLKCMSCLPFNGSPLFSPTALDADGMSCSGSCRSECGLEQAEYAGYAGYGEHLAFLGACVMSSTCPADIDVAGYEVTWSVWISDSTMHTDYEPVVFDHMKHLITGRLNLTREAAITRNQDGWEVGLSGWEVGITFQVSSEIDKVLHTPPRFTPAQLKR